MAVETEGSTQYDKVYVDKTGSLATHEMHGRMRLAYFDHAQATAGDATSKIRLFKLPAGKVRLFPLISDAYVNWTTAGAALDIGWDAYTDGDGNAVAADVDGIADGVDVDSAGHFTLGQTALLNAAGGTILFNSLDGVDIIASSTDTAIALADSIIGYMAYVMD